MSKKGSLVNFLSEEDRKRLLTFRPASELRKLPVNKSTPRVSVQSAAVVVAKPEQPQTPSMPIVSNICEFVRGDIFEGSNGRRCVDGTFCPARIYGQLAIFQICPTRMYKLKERKREVER